MLVFFLTLVYSFDGLIYRRSYSKEWASAGVAVEKNSKRKVELRYHNSRIIDAVLPTISRLLHFFSVARRWAGGEGVRFLLK